MGICEALRPDDYVTSTHRGHGHCLAKGAKPDRMFAELLGKEAGYCKGKGGSMHIADPATGNLGANAIVGGSAGIATGAAFAAKNARQRPRLRLLLRRRRAGARPALRSDEHRLPLEAARHLRLRKQYVQRVHALLGDDGGRNSGRPAAFGIPGESVDGQDVRGVYQTASAWCSARAAAKGPVFAVQHLSLPRPSRRRHQSRVLPRQTGRAALVDERDPIESLGKWLIEQKWPTQRRSTASRPKSRRR